MKYQVRSRITVVAGLTLQMNNTSSPSYVLFIRFENCEVYSSCSSTDSHPVHKNLFIRFTVKNSLKWNVLILSPGEQLAQHGRSETGNQEGKGVFAKNYISCKI